MGNSNVDKVGKSIYKYEVILYKFFLEGLRKHQKKGNTTLLKKIDTFLVEIAQHPTTGTGKPERLRGFGEKQIWSRRVDVRHRFIYEIREEEKKVFVFSCYEHYQEKVLVYIADGFM